MIRGLPAGLRPPLLPAPGRSMDGPAGFCAQASARARSDNRGVRMNMAKLPDDVRSPKPAGHPAAPSGGIGVLIVNLGTPEGDRLLVDAPLSAGIPVRPAGHRAAARDLAADPQLILLRRPHAKARDYESIWNAERDEGPLKTITRAQSEKLGERLGASGRGSRSTGRCATASRRSPTASKALQAKGCDRILVIPLYPQYCAATTATVGDKVFDALKTMRWQPAIRIAAPYYDDPVYIDALASSLRAGARRASISSRRSCSPRITAFRNPISTRAIPITAIAPRRRACSARRSAGTTTACG